MDFWRGIASDDFGNTTKWCELFFDRLQLDRLVAQQPHTVKNKANAVETLAGIAYAAFTDGEHLPSTHSLHFQDEGSKRLWADVWPMLQEIGVAVTWRPLPPAPPGLTAPPVNLTAEFPIVFSKAAPPRPPSSPLSSQSPSPSTSCERPLDDGDGVPLTQVLYASLTLRLPASPETAPVVTTAAAESSTFARGNATLTPRPPLETPSANQCKRARGGQARRSSRRRIRIRSTALPPGCQRGPSSVHERSRPQRRRRLR